MAATKKASVLELLNRTPYLTGAEIARLTGVSREYVRVIATQLEGPGALKRRRRLRKAVSLLERRKEQALKKLNLLSLPDEVRTVLERLNLADVNVKAGLIVLEDGTPIKVRKLSLVGNYLRILPPGINNGVVIYYDDEDRWYVLEAQEAPRKMIYVKSPVPPMLKEHLFDLKPLGKLCRTQDQKQDSPKEQNLWGKPYDHGHGSSVLREQCRA